jgi:asparagine synthase (glutamine-hydrolysing)
MRDELRPLVSECLSEERLKRQGIFNSRFVAQLLEEHLSGRADHRKALWTLLSFQLWYDRWSKA